MNKQKQCPCGHTLELVAFTNTCANCGRDCNKAGQELAPELIERIERETGQRVDLNDPNNLAVAGLLGGLARAMGRTSPHLDKRDDVAVGLLLRHQMTPEYKKEQDRRALLAPLLAQGADPDNLAWLL